MSAAQHDLVVIDQQTQVTSSQENFTLINQCPAAEPVDRQIDVKYYLSHPLLDLCHMPKHHPPIPNLEDRSTRWAMLPYRHSLKK
jgi:hypothetical protein